MKKDGEIPIAQPIQIGNDIVNIEAIRYQLRTQVCERQPNRYVGWNSIWLVNVRLRGGLSFQFDRNVVTHYQNQEQIYDYIFKHLGIDSKGRVTHPIILTECIANPNYCRQCEWRDLTDAIIIPIYILKL